LAEEDVIVEEVQAPVEEPQAEEAVPEEEVAEVSVEEPVADEVLDEPVAEVVEPETVEPVTLTREELLEQYADVFEAERNTARQRRESELRYESATREETQRRVAVLRKKLAESPDDDLESLNFVYDNAKGNSRLEVMRELAQQAATAWAPDAETLDGLKATIDATAPESMETYAAKMVAIAAQRIARQNTVELTADDIPADSPLAKSFAEREKARVDAARRAATLEARTPREPEPEVGVGGVVGNSGDRNPLREKLRTQGRAGLTVAELTQVAAELGVPLPD
jgi:hypothetical protein